MSTSATRLAALSPASSRSKATSTRLTELPVSASQFLGEALCAECGRHVAEPGAPERHGVDERLAQDHLVRGRYRREVEHPGMRPGQVEVIWRARPQVVADLPAVHLGDPTGGVGDRDDERAVEVLVADWPEDAECAAVGPELAPSLRFFSGRR